jgi:hypothetical protein
MFSVSFILSLNNVFAEIYSTAQQTSSKENISGVVHARNHSQTKKDLTIHKQHF